VTGAGAGAGSADGGERRHEGRLEDRKQGVSVVYTHLLSMLGTFPNSVAGANHGGWSKPKLAPSTELGKIKNLSVLKNTLKPIDLKDWEVS